MESLIAAARLKEPSQDFVRLNFVGGRMFAMRLRLGCMKEDIVPPYEARGRHLRAISCTQDGDMKDSLLGMS